MFTRAIAAGVAAAGLIDASAWVIGAGTLALAGDRAEACLAFADKYGAALGWCEAGSLFMAANLARGSFVCAIAFAAGRAAAAAAGMLI